MDCRQSTLRNDPIRTNANETESTRNRRNTGGARFRGGSRQGRGPAAGGRQPRHRTESWPAVRTGDTPNNYFVDRAATTNARNAGQRFDARQNARARLPAARQVPINYPFGHNFDRSMGASHGFLAFSSSAPPPPAPILEPNFYFEAENARRGVCVRPPMLGGFALRPMCAAPFPFVSNGVPKQRQLPVPRGNDFVRVMDKQFDRLRLTERPDNEARQSTKVLPGDGEPLARMPALIAKRELGLVNRDRMKRRVAEIRVRDGAKEAKEATTIRKILADDPGESLQQCQFMEATPDGKNIFGSWALRDRDWSRIMCASVGTSRGEVPEGRYGVTLQPSDNYIYVMDTNMVDLCQARVDVMVTCVLYLTVQPQEPRGSRIFLQPVPELSDSNDPSLFSTPIYNAHWALNEGALSCAWDFTQMRLSIGLERYGMIFDVVSETDFKLFSCHKNVLAQKFSKDGRLLFMGVRDSSILCCDLRRQYHHTLYALPQGSACWLQLLSDSNYLVAADLSGQINLWDLRTQRVLSSFNYQANSRKKLPVVVDEQDSLIFAVNDNGTTSGWSLKTGALLRQFPSPLATADRQTIPRICYSGCWGGVAGNAALVLGVGDEAHFYELQL